MDEKAYKRRYKLVKMICPKCGSPMKTISLPIHKFSYATKNYYDSRRDIQKCPVCGYVLGEGVERK